MTGLKIRDKISVTKKGSLARETGLMIIGLVAGTVLLCWLLNAVFLERYYVRSRQQSLLADFEMIDRAAVSGLLYSGDFDITFDNLCANGNTTILIISSDRAIVRSSVNNTEKLLREFTDIIFGERRNETTVLTYEHNYEIQRQRDQRLDSEYLVLYGTLADGNLILMRTAFASIRESVAISNRFLIYIGIVAVVVSALASLYAAGRVIKPLIRLTEISRRMAELDFAVKYCPKRGRRNEIDELGEHMNRLSMALEHTVSELKSANNQLLLDIEKKTQTDNMRKEFLSNVSHELKTPLALIQGYAEGLKECIHEDPQSRDFYCEVIMDEADKMNRMVRKLLTLNQLESGGETVTMEHFNLTELIDGVLHSVEILLQQSGITIAERPGEAVYVWADEFMVEEVLTNYLSNAIHHAQGRKQISIRCEYRGELVRVSVYNTGERIPEEELGRIWTKFYKVDKARTREYGGSGIGLSIVKATMEAFHRDCGVINRADGVEFWFELDAESSFLACHISNEMLT